MATFHNLTGLRFGRLTVISYSHMNKHNKSYWKCLCDCGGEIVTQAANLKTGDTKSCGCLFEESLAVRNTTHGKCGTPEYVAWNNMQKRCKYPNNKHYINYGGRGITVDPAFEDFLVFLECVGPKPFPSAQLDRIDNNGNYAPGNVRWASRKENVANRRNTQWVIPGKLLLVDAFREIVWHPDTVRNRARKLGLKPAEFLRDRLGEYGLEKYLGADEEWDDTGED